jgi:hypothetical protein
MSLAPPRSQLRSDLRATVAACTSAPWLLIATVIIQAGPAALDAAARSRSLTLLRPAAVIIDLLTIGFYGTQRVWLLRLYRGRRLSAAESWALTKAYFGPFLSLGVRVGLPVGVVMVGVALGTRSAIAILVTGSVLSYLLDTLLTFVVPELTFETTSAKEAWASGRTMLRSTWPESRWYVLAPGLAVIAVANILGAADRFVWTAALAAAVAGLLSLTFKGAILRYYVRLRPDTPDD